MATHDYLFTPINEGDHSLSLTQTGLDPVSQAWTKGPVVVNQPPVVQTIPVFPAPASSSFQRDLNEYISDPEGGQIIYSGLVAVGSPIGSISLSPEGILTFTAPAQTGSASWTFSISDDAGNVVNDIQISINVGTVVAGSTIARSMFPDRTIQVQKSSFGSNVDRVEPNGPSTRGYSKATPSGSHIVICLAEDPQGAATGTFTVPVRVVKTNGTVETWNVNVSVQSVDTNKTRPQWGLHDHYVPRRNIVTGESIIEAHPTSRMIYAHAVSGYDASEIAAEVGGGMVSGQVTPTWLAGQTTYGSIAKPLTTPLAHGLWLHLTPENGRGSPWLFLSDTGTHSVNPDTFGKGAVYRSGMSPIHPAVVTSYGGGTAYLESTIWFKHSCHNFVFKDLVIGDLNLGDPLNPDRLNSHFLFENVEVLGSNQWFTVQCVERCTLRRCRAIDNWSSFTGPWMPPTDRGKDRGKGLYLRTARHTLVEDCFFDWISFKPGYYYDGSNGMMPMWRSHAMYADGADGSHTHGTTLRDTCFFRGEGSSMQLRGGGRAFRCLFMDSNTGGFIGENSETFYGWADDVIVMSAGMRMGLRWSSVGEYMGRGWEIKGPYTGIDRMLIAHGFGPGNDDWPAMSGGVVGVPTDRNTKTKMKARQGTASTAAMPDQGGANSPLFKRNWHNHRWDGPSAGTTVPSGAVAAMDLATPMKFADAKLSTSGSDLVDFFDWAREQEKPSDWLDDFYEHATGPLGWWPGDRPAGGRTLSFCPNPDKDGKSWDAPKNWWEDQYWGLQQGDSTILDGGWSLCNKAHEGQNCELRNGHRLNISGALSITSALLGSVGSSLITRHGGRLLFPGYVDTKRMSLLVANGAQGNTASVTRNLSAKVQGKGYLLLGTKGGCVWRIGAAEKIEIVGSDCSIGWDGTNGGFFDLVADPGAILDFTFSGGGVSQIKKMRSSTTTVGRVNLNGMHLVLRNANAAPENVPQTLISGVISGSLASITAPNLPDDREVSVQVTPSSVTATVN